MGKGDRLPFMGNRMRGVPRQEGHQARDTQGLGQGPLSLTLKGQAGQEP